MTKYQIDRERKKILPRFLDLPNRQIAKRHNNTNIITVADEATIVTIIFVLLCALHSGFEQSFGFPLRLLIIRISTN